MTSHTQTSFDWDTHTANAAQGAFHQSLFGSLDGLMDELTRTDLLDSTMLVLTSDHGEELWDHGSFFHGQSLYDEQLHVPLLIRLPGREGAGTTVTQMVRTLDLPPTIADTLGLPHGEGWEGSSLVDTEGRPKDLEDREVLARAANPGKPFRTGVRTRARCPRRSAGRDGRGGSARVMRQRVNAGRADYSMRSL